MPPRVGPPKMKLHGKKDNWKDKSKDKSRDKSKKEKKEKTLGGKVLSKGSLAEALAIDTGFKRQDCTKIIDSLFKVAVFTVQKHGKFVLPGLAVFQSRDRPATEATEREIEGTMVEVKAKPAMTVVSATALAAFKKSVNGPREDQKTFWADAKTPKPEEETEAKSPASSGWSTLAEQVTAKLESPKHELTSPSQSSKQEWTPPQPPAARGSQQPRMPLPVSATICPPPPPSANICPPPPPASRPSPYGSGGKGAQAAWAGPPSGWETGWEGYWSAPGKGKAWKGGKAVKEEPQGKGSGAPAKPSSAPGLPR